MSRQHTAARRVVVAGPPVTTHRGQARRQGGQQTRGRWWVPAIVSLVLSLAALFAFLSLGAGASAGTLTVERTNYDFGQIRIYGGLVTARFPLTVHGTVRVVGLDTT